jgi:hypothetical protein
LYAGVSAKERKRQSLDRHKASHCMRLLLVEHIVPDMGSGQAGDNQQVNGFLLANDASNQDYEKITAACTRLMLTVLSGLARERLAILTSVTMKMP